MNVLAVGVQSNVARNIFTGQSIMFDGLVEMLDGKGDHVTKIDISRRFKSSATVFRCLDYAIVLTILFWRLLVDKYDLGYITTAQSKNGFLRDKAIIGLLRLFRVKVIAHQYGANYNQLLDVLRGGEKKKLVNMLNYCSAVIVEGQYMKNQYAFLKDYDSKVIIIPNGLPSVGKSAMRPKVYSQEKPFRMYYLSNLIWSKGYYDVLQAVDLLVNNYKKMVECVFAGQFMASADDEKPGISNKAGFDEYVKAHHLERVVSYFPGMYGDEKDAAFFKANVFVLPTYYINEGQPVSIIEAMAYGCVPIVTEYRHIPMMVTKENGCFVEPMNPQQIASSIVWLMEHPEEYTVKSKKSINDYIENFTFEKYASKVLQCMNEIVNI